MYRRNRRRRERVDWDQIYRILNIDGEKMNRQMEEEKRQMREESDQLRRKIEEGFARLHEWETPQTKRNRNTR